MSEELARVVSIISIVFTVASLALAVVFARKKTKIRVGFDLARAVIGVLAILVMAAVAGVATSAIAIFLAVFGGLALGFGQGSKLEITRDDKGFHARRSPVAIALWGAGIVIMQAAGLASRAGVVRLGQTIAWFSACLGIGLMVGRTGPLKRTAAGVGVAATLISVILPMAFVVGTDAPVSAQGITMTDEQMCDLTPGDWNWSGSVRGVEDILYRMVNASSNNLIMFQPTMPDALAGCANNAQHYADGAFIDVGVLLMPSVESAATTVARIAAEASSIGAIVSPLAVAYPYDNASLPANTLAIDFQFDDGSTYETQWLGTLGPFIVVGTAETASGGARDGDGRTSVDVLVERLLESIGKINQVLDSADVVSTTSPIDGTVAPTTMGATDTTVSTPGSDGREASGSTVGDSDEPIEPEEAARQAITGLIAAVAIGLITWGEASAEIAKILGGLSGGGSGGSTTSTIPPDFIDPHDGKTLEVDPDTGLVWWPWDGGSGRWVNRSEMPGLLDDWNRELDAETTRRVAVHEAQRDRNWQDLLDRSRRSELEEAARRADTDAFDRRVDIARRWMEEGDADSLERLDRIVQSVAARGYATDADIERARTMADRSRVWVSTKLQWDAADEIRITNNRNTVWEVTAKAASAIIDPTKGWVSGAIWGAVESWDRGDSMGAVASNAIFESTLARAGRAVDAWAPGRAAMGRISWGASSGALWTGGEVLVRGGTIEQAKVGVQTGFVLGGLSGGMEELGTLGTKPVPGTPKIRVLPGGPRVGYDAPLSPRLRPPELGGAGSMPPRTPTIPARPGGPTPYYDQPLNPRHVDPADPRYVPEGTPADQVRPPSSGRPKPPPKIIETDGPLGTRPPTEPSPGSPADAFGPAPRGVDRPRPHYDHPLSPRHVDPADPRYVPEGTPADQVPTPPSDWSKPPTKIIDTDGPLGPPPPPVDVPDGPIPGSKSDWSKPPTKIIGTDGPLGPPPPPVDVPDGPIPGSKSDWSKPPTKITGTDGPSGGRPPADTPSGSSVDALEGQPLGELPEKMPPTPEQLTRLVKDARPTRPAADILDDMMNQPRHPAGASGPGNVQEWQRGFFPDHSGRSSMIDADGRVSVERRVGTDTDGWPIVEKRHIGNVDPETGTLTNLDGEPMRVALDHRGVPVGYIEQPSVPAGMQPAYNARGELAGYVDGMGRADIGGKRVPVAFDSRGELVPYDAPPRSTGSPVEHLPPENLRGSSRLPGGDAEPVTGGGDLPRTPVDAPPVTGEMAAPPAGASNTPIDYTPYGNPIAAGDGAAPIGLSDLNTTPRIPVLDEGGGVSHLIEPGPREIHYDAEGTPFFVQRQHPVRSTQMDDIRVSDMRVPQDARPMPTPEVFDATEVWVPLAGEGAPPVAPDVIPPNPPGGSPP